ncbi:MAG: ABC transporter ATP-binding protein [Acidobacteriota bacterium]|nr:ABC transporter ATP-binding protein [Acidobacteriota bacterium]
MSPPAVVFDKVTHRYDRKEALRDVSFTIPRGAVFGLIGPNGSGKSTTLNILTTLLSHTEGGVQVCGFDVRTEAAEVKSRIGFAPEEVQLYNGLSAREFVELSAALHHMDPEAGARRAEHLLAHFGLEDRMDELLGSYSKGMRRKSLIAASMVHEPELLVLDEPLEGLDVVAQRIFKDMIREHAANGKTVIYSTHILEVLEGFATHVLLLRDGQVLGYGSVEQVHADLGLEKLADAFPNPSGSRP